MSLEQWQGPAKIIIGTFTHIGEFERTRELGRRHVKGLRITLEPIEMLQGPPDCFFSTGEALLQAIDWSVLDERPARSSSQARSMRRGRSRDRQ
jgi:hypothetical protein